MKIPITVIIPTYRDWDRLRLCIDALEEQSFPKRDFEMIIINNDPEGTIPAGFGIPDNACMIKESAPGSYAARNAGLEMAKGDLLAFTDSDCIPDKDWLKNAQTWFNENSSDLIGGSVNIFKERDGSRLIYTYEKYTSFRQEINIPKGKAITANLFVKKSIITKIGGFNSTVKSGEDWKFTGRCVANGYRLDYVENVMVSHPARKSFKELLVKQKRLVAWDIINKHNNLGHSKILIVSKHIKNGILKLIFQKHKKACFLDKVIITGVEFVRVVYRISIGLLILVNIIDPVGIRK